MIEERICPHCGLWVEVSGGRFVKHRMNPCPRSGTLVIDAEADPPQPVADDSSEEIQALPAQQPGRGPLAVARSTL